MTDEIPFTAFAALYVVEAGFTRAAVSVNDVRKTLTLTCALKAGSLTAHRTVRRA